MKKEAEQIRQVITEALSTGPAPIDDLRDYIRGKGYNLTNAAIGQHIRGMSKEGLILGTNIGYYLPKNTEVVQANPDRDRVEIAPFFRRRGGKHITIEHSPIQVTDVAQVKLIFAGNSELEFPVFNNRLRICIGPEVPEWSPEQVTYEGITRITIILRNGERKDINTSVKAPITFAPVV